MRKPRRQAVVPASEFSDSFVQGMYDRMAVSYFKYGKLANGYPDHADALGCLVQRLVEYRKTGNTEYLIDAANFAMIEFLRPSLRNAHYTPTDSAGSPGRVRKRDGMVSWKDNKSI